MNHSGAPAYGLWSLVIINSIIFIYFAYSFTRPSTGRDWRSFGAFSAFIVALFAEMYGFPLTIYLLSGWLGKQYPQLDILSHDNGHLLHTLFGFKGDPHWDPLHIASNVLLVLGFLILGSAWKVLYQAQQERKVARTGPYAYVRHPQYDAFIMILFGFLLQWPTLLTVLMFPVLVVMYARLAKKEERDVTAQLGADYAEYAQEVPAFIPRLSQVFGGEGSEKRRSRLTKSEMPR
jgi:protein-S-isoprenylcysteine O-methyltransferase Ste14